MDIAELAKVIDKTGELEVDGSGGTLYVTVTIKKVRTHHGVVDYLVTPIAGHGERWVRSHYVTLREAVSGEAVGWTAPA